MSAPEVAVRLLGELGADDRRWILEHLPIDARARLADHVDNLRETGASGSIGSVVPSRDEPMLEAEVGEDFEWGRSIARLASANSASLIQTLQSEPAWLVEALLSAAEWPWISEVKSRLPAGLRADIATLQRQGPKLGSPATRALVHELARRSREWPSAPLAPSGWRAFANRLRRGRSR
ncbi:MAG: hypothetical protein WDO56_22825 [Gammaproteobacteria bacterium]